MLYKLLGVDYKHRSDAILLPLDGQAPELFLVPGRTHNWRHLWYLQRHKWNVRQEHHVANMNYLRYHQFCKETIFAQMNKYIYHSPTNQSQTNVMWTFLGNIWFEGNDWLFAHHSANNKYDTNRPCRYQLTNTRYKWSPIKICWNHRWKFLLVPVGTN